jgi:hypothetical protein
MVGQVALQDSAELHGHRWAVSIADIAVETYRGLTMQVRTGG